jgi:hypothetical protein
MVAQLLHGTGPTGCCLHFGDIMRTDELGMLATSVDLSICIHCCNFRTPVALLEYKFFTFFSFCKGYG